MSVYFIQPEGEPVVKIGYANSVFGRMNSLQVSHHRRLILKSRLGGACRAGRCFGSDGGVSLLRCFRKEELL